MIPDDFYSPTFLFTNLERGVALVKPREETVNRADARQLLAIEPDRLGIGRRVMQRQADKPHYVLNISSVHCQDKSNRLELANPLPGLPPRPEIVGRSMRPALRQHNKDRTTMMIDTEWRVQNDPQHEARLLWTKIALA